MDARRVVAGAAALGLIAACGSGRMARERVAPQWTYLIVTNTNWADVTIFSVRGMTRSRIGFVSALSTRAFLVPRSDMPDGTVRLLVDPIGSDRAYVTESIGVSPGQHVELTVMPAMAMTTLAVRTTPRHGPERDQK